MSRYLDLVHAGVQTLVEKQSARLGDEPSGALCLTVTKASSRSYRSLGGRHGDSYLTYPMQQQPLEPEPYRLDMRLWPLLETLSDVSGEPCYRQMVIQMADGFARHGFDPASGLGYLGAQAQFDVLHRQPVSVTSYDEPTFKPAPHLPLARLWAQAPTQMARMGKAAYYGLVTQPETLDYNRYCPYGFDDADKSSPLTYDSRHVAFAQTGAFLIHLWAEQYARTGDGECLGWTQAMADKWRAVQHPESGLLPHWFGSDEGGLSTMPPRPYASIHESMTAIAWLQAAQALCRHAEGQPLAKQLAEMAHRLLNGLARCGYVPQEQRFPEWFHLDGRERLDTCWYAFRTEGQREEAAQRDPVLREVSVYAGASFYTAGPWAMAALTALPYDLALGESMLGAAKLLESAAALVADAQKAGSQLDGELNELGQWTFPATSSYAKTLLLLYHRSGDRRFLQGAQAMIDRQLDLLAQMPSSHSAWWRMPFRAIWLEALLDLHQTL